MAFANRVSTIFDLGVASDLASAALAVACGPSDTSFTTDVDASKFVPGSIAVINQEQIQVGSALGKTIFIQKRGYNNTTPAAHQVSDPIRVNYSAVYINNIVNELIATQTALAAGPDIILSANQLRLGTLSLFNGYSGTRPYTDFFADFYNVRTFAGPDGVPAKGDGVHDDAPAFQAALNYIALIGGGTLYIKAGKYKLSTQLTYSGAPLHIRGDGMSSTQLLFTGATAGLSLTMGSIVNQRINDCNLRGFTLSASAANCGDALSIVWTARAAGIAPMGTVEEVWVINEGVGYWTRALHLQNAGDFTFRRVYLYVFGDSTLYCLRVDNSLTMGSFGLLITESSFEGGNDCIYVTGWLESLYLANSAFVGGHTVIQLDGASTPAGCAHLTATNCHFNAKQYTISTNLWRAIFLNNCDIYSGVGTEDMDGTNLALANATAVQVCGCKFEIGSVAKTRNGILLTNVTNFSITGNTFVNMTAGGILLAGSTTGTGTISGNTILGYSGITKAAQGIFIGACAGDIAITGNTIDWFDTCVQTGAPNVAIRGNIFKRANTGASSSSTNVDARGNTLNSVTTPYSGSLHYELFASAVVTPPSLTNGSGQAQTVTVTGVALGQFVEYAAPYDTAGVLIAVAPASTNSLNIAYRNDSGGTKTLASGTWQFRMST